MKKLILLTVMCLAVASVSAQRIGLTGNFSRFSMQEVTNGGTNIDYRGSTSFSANFRYFTKHKWAYRVGAGIDNLNYTVGDGVNTDYSARRQDLKGILGIEKHFIIAKTLDIYPGAYVPIVVVGDDVIDALNSNYQNIQNGQVRSGLGLVLGANIRLLKILRLGVEFDANYDQFKQAAWASASDLSLVPIRNLGHTTHFTLGVAF
ncbi:MAG: hypothetical protein SF053_05520 [Bacteroidia bacterium]|nr:hypothetical protein [Bacteroidia bacterium]